MAAPLLSEPKKQLMFSLNVEFNDIYSVYEADAELRVLLYDIEEALYNSDDSSLISVSNTLYMIDTAVIERLSTIQSERFGTVFPCAVMQGNQLVLFTRPYCCHCVDNENRPEPRATGFGYNRFQEVTAHSERSDKDSFKHLDDGYVRSQILWHIDPFPIPLCIRQRPRWNPTNLHSKCFSTKSTIDLSETMERSDPRGVKTLSTDRTNLPSSPLLLSGQLYGCGATIRAVGSSAGF